jgi:hypothetical protein
MDTYALHISRPITNCLASRLVVETSVGFEA